MLRPRHASGLAGPQDVLSELVADPEPAGQPNAAVGAAAETPVDPRLQAVSFAVAVVGVTGAEVVRGVDDDGGDDDGDHGCSGLTCAGAAFAAMIVTGLRTRQTGLWRYSAARASASGSSTAAVCGGRR
jgi:hypothetical protein